MPQGSPRMQSLTRARECALLGTRLSAAKLITGLSRAELKRLFRAYDLQPRVGRMPMSADWYFWARLPEQVEASVLASLYVDLRAMGYEPPESLLGAYKHYHRIFLSPRLSMDRALEVISHLDGRWMSTHRTYELCTCKVCDRRHLAAFGSTASMWQEEGSDPGPCPFCRARRNCSDRLHKVFRIPSSVNSLAQRLARIQPHWSLPALEDQVQTSDSSVEEPDAAADEPHRA